MGTKIGGVGTSGDVLTYFKTPVSIGIQLDAGEYPSGTFTMQNLTPGGARWKNGNYSTALAVWLCLCDSNGNNKVRIATFTIGANSTSFENTWTVTGAEALAGKALYLIMEDSGYEWDTRDFTALQSWTGISCETAQNNYSIGMLGGTGGTIACNKYSAAPGETITVTCTPESGWSASAPSSSPSVAMTSAGANTWTFTMPASDITLTPNFSKINYTVSVSVTPSGSGSASLSKTTANKDDEITVTPSANSGWQLTSITTSPSLTVSNNKFIMPAGNVAVTVTFEKINYAVSVSTGTGGSASLSKTTAHIGDTITVTASPNSGYSANTPTASGITFTSAGTNTWTFTMPANAVAVSITFSKINYTVTATASPAAGGTVTLSKTTANIGDEITVTASPATGYSVTGISTSPSRTVTNNKFTMPAGNVAVTVTFAKINYNISGSASPAAGGTVTLSRSTATYGDSVTVSQTPATGYYFNGWTKTPSNLSINGSGQFSMPAQNVSLVANYLVRSTASFPNSVTGGETAKLTISPDKTTYTHKYRLNFGTNMDTGWVNVNANVREVNISIPDNWAQQIPNSATKTGGTMTVETYNGSTKIGEYVISNITYNVRSNALPTLSDITKSIARTIGGQIYANVGNYYVQNKCGVAISATAAGVLDSTIASISCTLSGYSGNSYNKTVTNTTSISYTTGLLTISGTITITVTATDSRGRTTTKTTTITVNQYNKPSGTLAVRRVDANGNNDVLGIYAKYEKTSAYTAIGSNSMTVKLQVDNGTPATINANSGDILPGNRQQFSQISEYTITLILQDAFETVNIVTKLPTAQFLISLGSDGTRMAFMKAVNESMSKNGKNGVLELSADAQVYVGNRILEYYVAQSMMYEGLIIDSNEDLNDYLTAGVYMIQQNATAETITHIPDSAAGKLFVLCSNSNVKQCIGAWRYFIQFYVTIYGDFYERTISTNDNGDYAYGTWKRFVTE